MSAGKGFGKTQQALKKVSVGMHMRSGCGRSSGLDRAQVGDVFGSL